VLLVGIATLFVSSDLAIGTSYIKPRWPLTHSEAIEEAFARADAVVMGRVLEFRTKPIPLGGGQFTETRTLVVEVGQVFKGNTKNNQIAVTPGFGEGGWDKIEVSREYRSFVILFLVDLAQSELDRYEPLSGKVALSHDWYITQFSDDHKLAILDPGPDRTIIPRLESIKREHSLEELTRQADLVVIADAVSRPAHCFAFGEPSICQPLSIRRVLKGQGASGKINAFSKGHWDFPRQVPAIYFLRRENDDTFEITHFSAGVRPIRANRLRESGVTLDEAISRIQAAKAVRVPMNMPRARLMR
jgi:hypothetical protein